MPVRFQQLRGNVERAARCTLADAYPELHPGYALGAAESMAALMSGGGGGGAVEAQRPPTEQPVITAQNDLRGDKTWRLPSSDRRGVHRLLGSHRSQARSGSVRV